MSDGRDSYEDGSMEIGERWGYRAHGVDPLVEVEVLKNGTKKPARTLVRFVAERFEGRQEWVPPARLKVPWEEVGEFEASEARWERVDTHPGLHNAPEEWAIGEVIGVLIGRSLVEGGSNPPGVVSILDPAGLAGYLEVEESVLRAAPECFEEDGVLVVPWATTQMIMRRACELHPEPMLRKVQEEEPKAELEAMHGRRISNSRHTREWFIGPEQAAVDDATYPFLGPCREVLRQWCGAEAVARHDELKALPEEVVRLDGLVTEAIQALRSAGRKSRADDLERRFGIPLPQARRS